MKNLFYGVALLMLPAIALATVVPDQEQTTVNLGTLGTGFSVGMPGAYQLAQTTKAGFDGFLTRIDLPMACEGGWLDIDITNVTADDVPGTRVLSHTELDALLFPLSDGYIWRTINLDSRVRMSAGDRFAIVLTNKSGRCGIGMGSSVDLYPDGRSVWRYEFTPPGVWMSTGGLADPIDAAFRTYLDVPNLSEAKCSVSGFHRTPIPAFTPLCACVQDAGLRELRCALFDPEMLLVRRMPFPVRAGQTFTVSWMLMPLVPLKGQLQVQDSFDGVTGPLTFIGEQVPVGQSLTLQYNAFAAKSGKLKAGTDLGGIEDGHLQTTIEILPP